MLTVELAAKLAAAGLTTGYAVFRNKMPSSPDKVISINETGGTAPEMFQGMAGIGVDQPTVQIRVRSTAEDNDGPAATINAIYRAIASWGAFTQNGVRYVNVQPLQPPFPLRRGENERVEFAVNFFVQKEPSTT